MYTLALDAFKRFEQCVTGELEENHVGLIAEFCDKMNIGYDTLFMKSRKPKFVNYRSLFFNWVNISHIELARLFNMHHSSIMHLRQDHANRLKYDNQYKDLHHKLNL